MATAQCDAGAHQATLQGGFPQRRTCKSRSIPLSQRRKQSFQTISKRLTGSLTFAIALLVTFVAVSCVHGQNLPAAENQKIEALIKQVGDLNDAKFVRNGSVYEPAIAARFLRGKWDANKTEAKTARDFIDKVATKSRTSGKLYLIRFNDGKEIPSREFLLAELEKLES